MTELKKEEIPVQQIREEVDVEKTSAESITGATGESDRDRAKRITYASSIIRQMLPIIETMNLKEKTEEEIRREIFVDFSDLQPVTVLLDEKMQAKVMLNLYRHQLQGESIRPEALKLHPFDRLKYDLKKYNNGIVALGVENFMTAATQFCEYDATGGKLDIVSVGSGDGTVEKDIIAEYRQRFGKDIRITLVDPDPAFEGIVDFKTVEELTEKKPQVVGNCVAFIIWPRPVGKDITKDNETGYDIEAVRKLQPKAVFVVYEATGGSGSNDFRICLHNKLLDKIPRDEFGIQNWLSRFHFVTKSTYGLDNYANYEIARQKIYLQSSGTMIIKMVKMVRMD